MRLGRAGTMTDALRQQAAASEQALAAACVDIGHGPRGGRCRESFPTCPLHHGVQQAEDFAVTAGYDRFRSFYISSGRSRSSSTHREWTPLAVSSPPT